MNRINSDRSIHCRMIRRSDNVYSRLLIYILSILRNPVDPVKNLWRVAATLGLLLRKQRAAVLGAVAELLFDPQQLVVLGHAVAARGAAGLDLAGAQGDGQVGDRRCPRFRRCGGW